MKKIAAILLLGSMTATAAKAQEPKDKVEKKERQEVIIRKNGNEDTKIVVEIKGDKVTINGKPLNEFKDENVTINKRNITVWDGDQHFDFSFAPDQFANGFKWENDKGFKWDDDKSEPRAFLGVSTDKNDDGALIENVTKESPAEKAGLKKGDVITKVNDKKVTDPESLSAAVTSFKPKEEVTIYYKRDGKDNSTKVMLGERRNRMTYSFSYPGNGSGNAFVMPRVDIAPNIQVNPDFKRFRELESIPRVYNFNDNDNAYSFFPKTQKLGLRIQDLEEGKGVKVLDVDKDSPAEKAGLKKDDIVTEIGGKKVNNTDEAREQLHDNADKSAYSIKATRNGSSMSFDIKIPKKLKTANL